MKNKLKVLGVIALVAVMGFSMIACGGSSLVGKWEVVKNGEPTGNFMEFFKDGTVIFEGVKLEWKTDKGRLILSAYGRAITWTYKLSGSTLTITDDDGDVSELRKVK